MSDTAGRRYLLLAPLLVVIVGVFFFWVEARFGAQGNLKIESTDYIWLATFTASSGTGAIILNRFPHHLVGWFLLAFGALGAVATGFYGLAIVVAETDHPTAAALVEGFSAAIISAAFVLLPASLFVFPTGALPSPRWRPLAWAMVLAAVLGGIAAFITGGFGGSREEVVFGPGPLTDTFGGVADAISGPFFMLLLISVAGAAVSLIFRYRRSVGDERQQIKWVAVAGAFLAATVVFSSAVTGAGQVTGGAEVLMSLALMAVPIAMAVAIIKYRLYDIDVIVSRSLTFGVLAAFIGVVYVAIVVGIGELFGRGGDASFGLSVAATAVVAIAFQPVRVRVEHWANRLVYGKRATPYEVLARFSHRGAEESDENVLARVPQLIVDGTGASEASLWVSTGTGFQTASVWPEATSNRTLHSDTLFDDPQADLSLPVFHDGELLGGISLVTAQGATLTPTEEDLLTSLADGMGLTLRNSQLTAALRRQVKDLQRSRDRVVSAADEARRALEHDLDSGPQQQLVALKVKLGPTRVLAEQAGAAKTAMILADIEKQTGEAIRAIREFAAGIYPPLLGAEGLAAALGQQTQKAALPVSLDTESISRYPRDVEAAVYFTVLEALQNTAKYADASTAEVRLFEQNGDLRFEISDDGVGFDKDQVSDGAGLNGISDRMDTIGGSWHIESSPGIGTRVVGSVPVRDPARV